jgi:hypothetical protein
MTWARDAHIPRFERGDVVQADMSKAWGVVIDYGYVSWLWNGLWSEPFVSSPYGITHVTNDAEIPEEVIVKSTIVQLDTTI